MSFQNRMKPITNSSDEITEGMGLGKTIEPHEALGKDYKGPLPEGVSFYMREMAELDAIESQNDVRWYLYRVKKVTGSSKEKLAYVCRCEARPEPDWIQETYGAGTYRWNAKWKNITGEEVGCYSQSIMIDDFVKPVESSQVAKNDSGHAVLSSLEFSFSLMDRLTAMAKNMAGIQPQQPAQNVAAGFDTIERLQAKMAESYERMIESQLKQQEKLALAKPEKNMPTNTETDEIPSWLKPAMPLVEKAFNALAGGGFKAEMAKEAVLDDAEFVRVFNDPEKWQMVIRALVSIHGETKVAKALDVLNGVKSTVKAAKAFNQ